MKQIITYLLPHTSHHLLQRFRQKRLWLPKLGYGLGFAALLMMVLWFGNDFQRSLTQVSTIQRYLTQYQLYLQQNNPQEATIFSINSALPLLNTLETAADIQNHPSRLEQLETVYSQKSQQTALSIYQTALQSIIIPQIKSEFEKYFQAGDDKTPEQLYIALKAYLMLKKPDSTLSSSEQATFILKTLENISPVLNKRPFTKEFTHHVQNALQAKQDTQLNGKVIRQARKILNLLSDQDLAYILLKNMNNNNVEMEVNLGTNIGTPPALISKGTATLIPQMFTAEAFNQILKVQVPLAAQDAIKGNEVLGKKSAPLGSLISDVSNTDALAEQLEKTYLSHYIDIWESLVDNISLNTPKSLTETDAMIMNLISSHSPLLQLLQAIHSNTNLEPILSNSYKLQALNTLFNQTQTKQKDSLYQIFMDLHQLHLFLQQANAAHFSKEKIEAKQSTINQILNMTDKYPEPIKNWLQSLVSFTQNQLQAELKPSSSLEQKAVLVQNNNVPSPPATALALPKETVDKKPKAISEPSLIPQHKHKLAVHAKNDYVKIMDNKKTT